ncbi:hypothetical protein GCM10008096_30640 [Zhihengliuella salsuginis]|uniref:Phosphoribulokinase/uridine kinase domain-containing protein n=1 Tax=Zhihengliuella salsuginis TaxID=578222 RepID=A0ABQ3GLY2_9MICC|nr:hypothetical protein GCM10008096_30640 [Zhihengliuella salsuginis]
MHSSSQTLILLGGASGAGKSYLAARFGRPHLVLDNFYREISEHLPESPLPQTPYGEIDWDDPGTWNTQAAVDAVIELLETGQTQVPDYTITTSSYDGYTLVSLDRGPVIAEGIFGDRIVEPLRRQGVQLQAIYVDSSPLSTAVRRFARDVAERRKPIPFLIRRGISLYRTEGGLRRRYLDAGFVPMRKLAVKKLLGGLR